MAPEPPAFDPGPPPVWEGDRWLDDELLPFIAWLGVALRERPEWQHDGFRKVTVLSYAGWHHVTGQEDLLEITDRETVEDTVVVVLTRALPPPDGRVYYAAIPLPHSLLTTGEEHGWLAETLLRQAVDAAPTTPPPGLRSRGRATPTPDPTRT